MAHFILKMRKHVSLKLGHHMKKKPLVNALWSLNNTFSVLFPLSYHNIYFVKPETSDTEFQAESGNYLFTMFRFRPTNCKYTYNESNTPNQCISNKDCLCLCFSTFNICITTTVLMFPRFSLVRGCDYFSGRWSLKSQWNWNDDFLDKLNLVCQTHQYCCMGAWNNSLTLSSSRLI